MSARGTTEHTSCRDARESIPLQGTKWGFRESKLPASRAPRPPGSGLGLLLLRRPCLCLMGLEALDEALVLDLGSPLSQQILPPTPG